MSYNLLIHLTHNALQLNDEPVPHTHPTREVLSFIITSWESRHKRVASKAETFGDGEFSQNLRYKGHGWKETAVVTFGGPQQQQSQQQINFLIQTLASAVKKINELLDKYYHGYKFDPVLNNNSEPQQVQWRHIKFQLLTNSHQLHTLLISISFISTYFVFTQ